MIEEGKEPSNQFYEQPELGEGEIFYWDAFSDLGLDRSYGMGVGPIPYSSIRRYANEYDIIGRDEFDHFLDIIKELDDEYLRLINPKSEPEMIPVTDVGNVRDMFVRMKARQKAEKK